jgi:hypothetical protein
MLMLASVHAVFIAASQIIGHLSFCFPVNTRYVSTTQPLVGMFHYLYKLVHFVVIAHVGCALKSVLKSSFVPVEAGLEN